MSWKGNGLKNVSDSSPFCISDTAPALSPSERAYDNTNNLRSCVRCHAMRGFEQVFIGRVIENWSQDVSSAVTIGSILLPDPAKPEFGISGTVIRIAIPHQV